MAEGAESSAGPLSAFLLLVAAIVWVGHFLKHNRLIFLTQGSLALLSGLAAGGGLFLYYEGVKKSHIPPALVAFNYSIYMDLLLPPIIFYAGESSGRLLPS